MRFVFPRVVLFHVFPTLCVDMVRVFVYHLGARGADRLGVCEKTKERTHGRAPYAAGTGVHPLASPVGLAVWFVSLGVFSSCAYAIAFLRIYSVGYNRTRWVRRCFLYVLPR